LLQVLVGREQKWDCSFIEAKNPIRETKVWL